MLLQSFSVLPEISEVQRLQHSSVSLLIKRKLLIFERVPLPQPGFEPGTYRIRDEHPLDLLKLP